MDGSGEFTALKLSAATETCCTICRKARRQQRTLLPQQNSTNKQEFYGLREAHTQRELMVHQGWFYGTLAGPNIKKERHSTITAAYISFEKDSGLKFTGHPFARHLPSWGAAPLHPASPAPGRPPRPTPTHCCPGSWMEASPMHSQGRQGSLG